MNYDLIAIDIDGTLITQGLKIANPVFEAVQRVVKVGKKIVLCTGRPFPGAKPYMEELGLINEGDFMITYHGALVQRTDTLEEIIHYQLNQEDLLQWQTLATDLNSNFQAVRNDGVYTHSKNLDQFSLVEPFVNNIPLRIRTMSEMKQEMAYSKFLITDEFEVIQNLEDHTSMKMRQNYTVFRSTPNTIEVLNKKASKGQSLKELAHQLNIPKERVMAIGDSGNDIDMVEYAGLGVAMGNAIPEVKDVADVVTTTNEENGVAKAINRYFFEE